MTSPATNAPVTHIDPSAFAADPYPTLARMRAEAPVTYVPELGAILFTKRDDIFTHEKNTEVFSSCQPDGLMTLLMGENMMRKDGEAHTRERKILFPALSPRTARDHWTPLFRETTARILADLKPKGKCDLVRDFAMPASAEALKLVTGLENMAPEELDRTSQGMIDGCANYTGDPVIEATCHDCTASIDAHITEMMPRLNAAPNKSALSVQMQAGLDEASTRANIKLIISGGQNEPRDAIAGAAWALLTHPDQHALIQNGSASYAQAFEEYVRWISPIGMSPRRIARDTTINGITFPQEARAFFMFSSAGHDEAYFTDPTRFDITRDTGPAIPFGAGPHFCGGAAISRALIADIALPMLLKALPGLTLAGPVPFQGWAFRGPLSMPVEWKS
ncbi:cytochrome P450 [Rhodalgimonas zhirmunskyi]|uniref:Cytochrome P450 n=1 Tax=Rhodalgimonas zhirmunskyi TaxID=2964767 RepID=A0AAJ1X553_9RHOB|nr:cytochrome P450 [Rhodoalgimonas zhirmunskyi]MDQ2093189.1 cytochrome P450 [Rhodoalgimonas zhirmunskyi]